MDMWVGSLIELMMLMGDMVLSREIFILLVFSEE